MHPPKCSTFVLRESRHGGCIDAEIECLVKYFVVKSCNRENLELSVQQGVWATQRNNEAKLNEAFDSVENVILIFSVNRTQHFQGCAKMTSRIGGSVSGGNWKYAHGSALYGRNFSVKWLKGLYFNFPDFHSASVVVIM
ncbi:unnamed protein product [Ilex paraguariensis]|uniref:YTH domain-containing family protein n=1 Tax=Ilex paraguariensis TaxID=185542 RepID=A0ABC8RFA4_9AQUA